MAGGLGPRHGRSVVAVERCGKQPRDNGATGANTPCWEAGGWTVLVAWRGDRAHREIASQRHVRLRRKGSGRALREAAEI